MKRSALFAVSALSGLSLISGFTVVPQGLVPRTVTTTTTTKFYQRNWRGGYDYDDDDDEEDQSIMDRFKNSAQKAFRRMKGKSEEEEKKKRNDSSIFSQRRFSLFDEEEDDEYNSMFGGNSMMGGRSLFGRSMFGNSFFEDMEEDTMFGRGRGGGSSMFGRDMFGSGMQMDERTLMDERTMMGGGGGGMMGSLMGGMMGGLMNGMAESLQSQRDQMGGIFKEAEEALKADPDVKNLLGDNIEISAPFSQSSRSANINGQSKMELQASFYVQGSRQKGTATMTASGDGIDRLDLQVGGKSILIRMGVKSKAGGTSKFRGNFDKENAIDVKPLDSSPVDVDFFKNRKTRV